jgi:hypothetical protein
MKKDYLSGHDSYLHHLFFERVAMNHCIISVSGAIVVNGIGRATQKGRNFHAIINA